MNVIELTQKLVSFDTINPPGYEVEICEYLEGVFKAAGFKTQVSHFGKNGRNLIATIGGNANKPSIAFTGHMDTVPLGADDWSYDPFSGTIENGRMYGRGTCDMKGGVAAAICAVLELNGEIDYEASGITFIITGAEETGAEGAKSYTDKANMDDDIGALVVAEPTSLIPLAGHKGALWLKASCKGKTAHGSMPEEGDNAIYKMSSAIQKLQDFKFNALRHDSLGNPSLNVGTIRGGLNTNSVADYAEIAIDIRTLPSQQHNTIIRNLQNHLGNDVSLEPMVDLPGVWTGGNLTWFSTLEDLVAQTTGKKFGVRAAPYFTDASVLTPHFDNVPTVILGPGSPQVAHTTNEYCEVEELHKAVDIYKSIIVDWFEK